MKQRAPYFVLILVLFIADQVTKTLVARNIVLNTGKEIIPNLFQLVHIRNRGAIFGFFSHSGNRFVFLFLTLASLAALSLVFYYFFKSHPKDRLFNIDFLDVSVKGWHWPSFNVADSCISIGAVLLIFIFLFKRSPICTQSS
jgi:signal peptidase II